MEDDTSTTISENLGRRRRKNQYIVSLVVSIISFSQGSFSGWTSPILPLLQSQDTPAGFPPIGDEETSWIGSVSSLSSVFAIPLCSYSIDKLGRKYTGYISAAPVIICWVLTLCADSVYMLYAARFVPFTNIFPSFQICQ
ncbi:hypothetical protein PR048_022848 [Dryococelus australis]|uniref:Major facilitator superfamily (MFS) profile domain-containing protein n=1 Tax=Dryococelus australis TaxID=614101 RepID=A0ABQ9GSF8_9NEOP|nr:hypothetical protein PR048_022848 [Dryococelus australis]